MSTYTVRKENEATGDSQKVKSSKSYIEMVTLAESIAEKLIGSVYTIVIYNRPRPRSPENVVHRIHC